MMTIAELQAQLRAIHARIGFAGRFTATLDQGRRATWSVSHWSAGTGSVMEQCEVVGAGSLRTCLAALERYADRHRSRRRSARVPQGRSAGAGELTEGSAGSTLAIEELQSRIREIHAGIGFQGRFSFTIPQELEADCYVTHWVRPAILTFEDCRAVGAGDVNHCLAALARYADDYRREAVQGIGRAFPAARAALPDRYRSAAE